MLQFEHVCCTVILPNADLYNTSTQNIHLSGAVSDLESALDGCSKFSLPRSLNHSLGRTKGDLPLHSTQSVLRDSLQSLRLNDATHQISVLSVSDTF